ncbi:hypothetical protein ABBQ32_001754 [Trebouxia sp. C0010 RCD-2024]
MQLQGRSVVQGPTVIALERGHQPATTQAGTQAFVPLHPELARHSFCKNTTLVWSLQSRARQLCRPSLQFRVSAQAGSPSRQRNIQQIPIFPLGMVALPGAVCPLNIFEARYRVLFSTLLAGDDGVEDGLINHESPFCGSKRFGISHMNSEGRVSEVGTLLKIEGHRKLPDGQITTFNRGLERYKIMKVVQKQPILIAEVEMMPAEDDASPKARQLAAELVTIVKQLIELNVKARKIKADESDLNPPELNDLYPTRLSFFVASLLLDNYMQQQALLSLENTVERLEVEIEVLGNTLRYLSARFALQGAFAPSTSETEAEGDRPPSASGPD